MKNNGNPDDESGVYKAKPLSIQDYEVLIVKDTELINRLGAMEPSCVSESVFFENQKSDAMSRIEDYKNGIKILMGSLNAYAIETFSVKHVSGGLSTCGLKSYAQGWEKFQGTEKHIADNDYETKIP